MKKLNKSVLAILVFFCYVVMFLVALFLLRELALGHYGNIEKLSNPFISFDYVLNTGAAFGLLKQQSAFLCGIAAFVLCFMIAYIFKNHKKISDFEINILAMLFAGIIANTFERLQTGAVIDYINLNFINFPVFNIADLYICLGAIILVFVVIFKR